VAGTVDAVVFDFGGVLTNSLDEVLAAWMLRDRIDPASFSRVLKQWYSRKAAPGTPIHRLETGQLPVAQFNVLLAAELSTVDGSVVAPDGLMTRVYASMRMDEQMVALLQELRALGLQVALLSNSWGNSYPRPLLDRLLDPVVISEEVGLRKPEASIYDLTLTRLGLPAGRAVFVDDSQRNVDGASAVGMHAYLHRDAAATRAALTQHVPGLAATAFKPGLAQETR
jgi:putative hydrolase of the HAD superfamily